MDDFINKFFAFLDPLVGSKEAGIVELIIGFVVILIAALVISIKKKNGKGK